MSKLEFYQCPAYFTSETNNEVEFSVQDPLLTNSDPFLKIKLNKSGSLAEQLKVPSPSFHKLQYHSIHRNPAAQDKGYVYIYDNHWERCRFDSRVTYPKGRKEHEFVLVCEADLQVGGTFGQPKTYFGFDAFLTNFDKSKYFLTIKQGDQEPKCFVVSIDLFERIKHADSKVSLNIGFDSIYLLESFVSQQQLEIPKLPEGYGGPQHIQ
jgi:hypothetical protein